MVNVIYDLLIRCILFLFYLSLNTELTSLLAIITLNKLVDAIKERATNNGNHVDADPQEISEGFLRLKYNSQRLLDLTLLFDRTLHHWWTLPLQSNQIVSNTKRTTLSHYFSIFFIQSFDCY